MSFYLLCFFAQLRDNQLFTRKPQKDPQPSIFTNKTQRLKEELCRQLCRLDIGANFPNLVQALLKLETKSLAHFSGSLSPSWTK